MTQDIQEETFNEEEENQKYSPETFTIPLPSSQTTPLSRIIPLHFLTRQQFQIH